MIYRQSYTTTRNMYGFLKYLKPSAILDFFQTAASNHATRLGLGMDKLGCTHNAWVLLRLKYEFYEPMEEVTEVIVETWPHPIGSLDFDRDFLIYGNGKVMVKGTSKWVIINTESRRIERANRFTYPGTCASQNNGLIIDKMRVDLTDFTYLGEYVVGQNDIDSVGHLNNTKYADMIFEFFPYSLRSLEINYLHESRLGDKIQLQQRCEGKYQYVFGVVNDEIRFITKFIIMEESK